MKKYLAFLIGIALISIMEASDVTIFAPIKSNIEIPKEPFLGEKISVRFSITFVNDIYYIFGDNIKKDNDKFIEKWLEHLQWNKDIPRYIKIELYSEGTDIIFGEKDIYIEMMKGETKSFTVDLDLKSSPLALHGIAKWFFAKKYTGPCLVAPVEGIGFVLINKKTGQLGTRNELQELLNKLPEYRYDIVLGEREEEWKLCPQEEVDRIRETLPDNAIKHLVKIQEQMIEIQLLDSTITDLEALEMLHDIEYEMLVRYGISDRKEAIDIFIRARKLSKEAGLSKWKAVEKVSGKKSLLDGNSKEDQDSDPKIEDGGN